MRWGGGEIVRSEKKLESLRPAGSRGRLDPQKLLLAAMAVWPWAICAVALALPGPAAPRIDTQPGAQALSDPAYSEETAPVMPVREPQVFWDDPLPAQVSIRIVIPPKPEQPDAETAATAPSATGSAEPISPPAR